MLWVEPDICPNLKVVIDWVDIRKGQRHDVGRIETDSNFVKRVYFYPSERVSNSHATGLKDAVVVSFLTDEQIQSTDYSEFIVRKQVQYLMKQNGIRGPKNGMDPKDPTKQKYHSIKLESRQREVHPLILSKPEIPKTYLTSRDVFLSLGSR